VSAQIDPDPPDSPTDPEPEGPPGQPPQPVPPGQPIPADLGARGLVDPRFLIPGPDTPGDPPDPFDGDAPPADVEDRDEP
jgi:hypothetical protein